MQDGQCIEFLFRMSEILVKYRKFNFHLERTKSEISSRSEQCTCFRWYSRERPLTLKCPIRIQLIFALNSIEFLLFSGDVWSVSVPFHSLQLGRAVFSRLLMRWRYFSAVLASKSRQEWLYLLNIAVFLFLQFLYRLDFWMSPCIKTKERKGSKGGLVSISWTTRD